MQLRGRHQTRTYRGRLKSFEWSSERGGGEGQVAKEEKGSLCCSLYGEAGLLIKRLFLRSLQGEASSIWGSLGGAEIGRRVENDAPESMTLERQEMTVLTAQFGGHFFR